MRRALSVLLFVAAAGPALAAGDPPASPPGAGVEMPYLMAPMNEDGRLAYYAYISTRLGASSATGAIDVRDKIAFIQDAFVRDVNGAGVAKADDPKSVDIPALEARLLADARRIVGAAAANIRVTNVQIAPLHPRETPKLSVAPPDAKPPPSGG